MRFEQLERAAAMDLPFDVARRGLAIDFKVEASFSRNSQTKTARDDRAEVCQWGLNSGGQWPLYSPSSRAAVASSRLRVGADIGCSG
jgi:hypothetical protein